MKRLIWTNSTRRTNRCIGKLTGEPGVTLFHIDSQGEQFLLSGVFMPDGLIREEWPSLEAAEDAAERWLNAWVTQHTKGWPDAA